MKVRREFLDDISLGSIKKITGGEDLFIKKD
jgi:hypothetical protein